MTEKIVVRKTLMGAEARKKLLEGINAVANPVKATMGAKGRTVFTSYGHTTKDGVTVARDVEMSNDPFAGHGANLVKAAAVKTCDVAGDGTTATCVLAQALATEGLRLVDTGKDAQELKREMEAVKEQVLEGLRSVSQKTDDVSFIARVSANDQVVGDLCAKAVAGVGADGMVTIEKTYDKTDVEFVEGMQIDRGVFSPAFFTDIQRRKVEYDEALVIIFGGKIHDVQGFAKVLEPLAAQNKAILVIADEFDTPVLRMLELSRIQGGVRVLPIKSPIIYHKESLDDIAAFTGATVLTEADGFRNFQQKWLGRVKSVIATTERTIIRSVEDRTQAIEERVASIYEYAKDFTEAERKNVEKRAARLKGKMAVIKFSATTDAEWRETKDRIDDAVFASQAALQDGIIPGGGSSFIFAADKLAKDTDGSVLVARALEAPLRQIVRNAGKNDSDILREVRRSQKGYNVVTDAYEDLMATGIVDPLKVATTAFENALSVACLAITTECLNGDVKE